MVQLIVQRLPSHFMSMVSRIAAATLGGYVLAHTLPMVLVAWWPIERADSVLVATQLSFLVYAAAIIWVFAARTAGAAWLGLVVPAVLTSLLAWGLI